MKKAPLQDISKAEKGTCCADEDKENGIYTAKMAQQ